jgi:hypothetical protein
LGGPWPACAGVVRPQVSFGAWSSRPPVQANLDSLPPALAGDLAGTLYAGSPCGSIPACFVPRCRQAMSTLVSSFAEVVATPPTCSKRISPALAGSVAGLVGGN